MTSSCQEVVVCSVIDTEKAMMSTSVPLLSGASSISMATSGILKEFNCGPDPLLIFTVPPCPGGSHTSWVWAVSARKYFFYCRGHVLLCIPSASCDMKYSLAGARYEASRRCRRSRTVHIEPEWPLRERCGQPWRPQGQNGICLRSPLTIWGASPYVLHGIFKKEVGHQGGAVV